MEMVVRSGVSRGVKDKLGEIGFLKYEIKYKFGIRVKDHPDIKWSKENLNTAYESLSIIDNKLGGNLKNMVAGTTFQIAGKKANEPGDYRGKAGPEGIFFYVRNSGIAIPDINFLHEMGQLIDAVPATRDAFSGLIQGTPNWVDEKGYVNSQLLGRKFTQPVQAYPMGEAFDKDEYWADAFGNYMADNIDVSLPAGLEMYIFVRVALARHMMD
jgi:hypothetical protein